MRSLRHDWLFDLDITATVTPFGVMLTVCSKVELIANF
jgi:hypothetical protein